MRFPKAVMGVVIVLIAISYTQAAVTVVYDPGTTNTTTALTGFSTTGAMMDGMAVTAFFANSTSETKFWADTGLTSGGVSSAGWSLTESGDTYGGIWNLSNSSGTGMTRLLIDAGVGNTVYDTTAIGDVGGTPGSESGWSFQLSGSSNINITATYRDLVALSGNAPVGDLFRYLDLTFTSTGGLSSGSAIAYITDTDNLLFAGDIQPTIPEPTTFIIWSLLGGLGISIGWWRHRKAA